MLQYNAYARAKAKVIDPATPMPKLDRTCGGCHGTGRWKGRGRCAACKGTGAVRLKTFGEK